MIGTEKLPITIHTKLEYEHRRKLAADVTELGMLAGNLSFDQRFASATRVTVWELQHRLAALLPLASASADRLDRLRALDAIDTEIATLKLTTPRSPTPEATPAAQLAATARCGWLASWRPFVMCNLKVRTGLADVVSFIETRGLLKV
jgi:hypothetical protein